MKLFLKLNFEIELVFTKKKQKKKNFFDQESSLSLPPVARAARNRPPHWLRHCFECVFYSSKLQKPY